MPDYATVTDISQLQKLASELNKTYIYYGKTGRDSYKAMVSNEKNAMNARQSTFEDLLYHKISDRYQGKQNEWDLVDYIKSRNGNLKNIDAAFLPDSLKDQSRAAANQVVDFKRKKKLSHQSNTSVTSL